jgi:hypothetical protein
VRNHLDTIFQRIAALRAHVAYIEHRCPDCEIRGTCPRILELSREILDVLLTLPVEKKEAINRVLDS